MTPPTDQSPPAAARFWTVLRILNVRLRFILLMVVVGLVAGNWDDIMNRYDRLRRPARASSLVRDRQVEYYCPMHPNVVRAEAANCPICGMPLWSAPGPARRRCPKACSPRSSLRPSRSRWGASGARRSPTAC